MKLRNEDYSESVKARLLAPKKIYVADTLGQRIRSYEVTALACGKETDK